MTIFERISSILPLIENALKQEGGVFSPRDYGDLFRYHFGLGLWIRNTLLDEKEDLYKAFVKNGVFHKDDQSQIMLTMFYFYMREKNTREKT